MVIKFNADSDTDDGSIDWSKQPPIATANVTPALFSASTFRSPSAIRSTYLGCVPKTSAATSTATTRTVQTVSSASNTSVSNPNSKTNTTICDVDTQRPDFESCTTRLFATGVLWTSYRTRYVPDVSLATTRAGYANQSRPTTSYRSR